MAYLTDLEKTILENICKNQEIGVDDIENLMEIEREYELSGRRSGRIDRIREYINNKI